MAPSTRTSQDGQLSGATAAFRLGIHRRIKFLHRVALGGVLGSFLRALVGDPLVDCQPRGARHFNHRVRFASPDGDIQVALRRCGADR